jgi:hypothetical protein
MLGRKGGSEALLRPLKGWPGILIVVWIGTRVFLQQVGQMHVL